MTRCCGLGVGQRDRALVPSPGDKDSASSHGSLQDSLLVASTQPKRKRDKSCRELD